MADLAGKKGDFLQYKFTIRHTFQVYNIFN